jgi:hypothetical protein
MNLTALGVAMLAQDRNLRASRLFMRKNLTALGEVMLAQDRNLCASRLFVGMDLTALGEVMLAQDRNLHVSGNGKCLGRLVNCKMRLTGLELVLSVLYTDPG